MSYGPLTAERIAETNALLAAYEAAHDFNGHWATFGACEGRKNSESAMGRFDEAQRIRTEMNRITSADKPIIAAAVAELMKPRPRVETITHEAAA